MNLRLLAIGTMLCALAGCGTPEPPPAAEAPTAQRAQSVFDPWVGTIDRAKGAQSTVDEQAAEQRRRIAELER
jgi:hypothetical protein